MEKEIIKYLKDNGVLCTDAKISTMEEAREFVKGVDRTTPSDDILERCRKEGVLDLNDDGMMRRIDEK